MKIKIGFRVKIAPQVSRNIRQLLGAVTVHCPDRLLDDQGSFERILAKFAGSIGDFMFFSLRNFPTVRLGKVAVNQALYRAMPTLYWKRRLRKLRQLSGEHELMLLPVLCDTQKQSIDVGADDGLYTVRMAELSHRCVAFEARPKQASLLQEMVDAHGLDVTVCAVALSDTIGRATLRILDQDGGRSTIETANALKDPDGSSKSQVNVPTRTLDSYDFYNVGCIKIDVEGHELAVLLGSRETLKREMPNIVIETEERHKANAVRDVIDFLTMLGYRGYFVNERVLTPVSAFDTGKHQDPVNIGSWRTQYARHGIYINNFIFVPAANTRILSELERAL